MDRISKIIKESLGSDDHKDLKQRAQEIKEKMKKWDEDMVQRKSKAYDDVENFPNKFTANWLFMVNQTNSEVPKVNNGSKERRSELEAQWMELKKTYDNIMDEEVPALNKALYENGIGAI